MKSLKLAAAVALPFAAVVAIAYGASPAEQDVVTANQLTPAEALDHGKYKAILLRDLKKLSNPIRERINWEQGSDLGDLMAADLTIGLSKMAEQGWTLAFIEPAHSILLGDGAKMNYPTVYIFKRTE